MSNYGLPEHDGHRLVPLAPIEARVAAIESVLIERRGCSIATGWTPLSRTWSTTSVR